MTGTKVLLILLILMVVLFIVFVVWGMHKNGPATSDWHTFLEEPHPVINKLGDLFPSPSPKLKPSELIPNPSPLRRAQPDIGVSPGKFILRFGDQPTTFDVSPDSGHKLRRATFSVTSSVTRSACATIAYHTLDDSGRDLNLNKQSWPTGPDSKNDQDPKNPTKVTFQAVSARGQLTFTLQQTDCVVQLE